MVREAPLLQFNSHISGKSADVRIVTDRLEWFLAGRKPVTDMLVLTGRSSVSIKRDGVKWKLIVRSGSRTVEFRVDRSVAELAQDKLAQLIDAAESPRELTPVASSMKPDEKGTVAEELITLKWLLDAGILSDDAFQEERARLMGF
jgi:hypothetical protein